MIAAIRLTVPSLAKIHGQDGARLHEATSDTVSELRMGPRKHATTADVGREGAELKVSVGIQRRVAPSHVLAGLPPNPHLLDLLLSHDTSQRVREGRDRPKRRIESSLGSGSPRGPDRALLRAAAQFPFDIAAHAETTQERLRRHREEVAEVVWV